MSDDKSEYTILFMSKDPENRYSLVSLLEAEGFKVYGRSTRERVAQLMSVYTLDLILMDLDLQESSGIDYCGYLRTTRYARVVPIIMIGMDDEHGSNCISAYDAGADDFVTTPFVFGVCLAKINYHLRRRSRRQQAAVYSSMSVVVSAGELPGVLQYLEIEQKTGKLTIKGDAGTATLTLDQGRLVNAEAPVVDGPEVVTEILTWDSSSVIFQDQKLDDTDRQFDAELTKLLMNSSVEVDEFHELQRKLPSEELIFAPGTADFPKKASPHAREVHKNALNGYSLREVLTQSNCTERQATIALMELLDAGTLATDKPPYEDYTRLSFKAYLERNTEKKMSRLVEEFSQQELPSYRDIDEQAPKVDGEWAVPAPIIVIAGNKAEHGKLLVETISDVYRGLTGQSPDVRKHLGGTASTRLLFGDRRILEFVQLPASLERGALTWLEPHVPNIHGVILIASDQDRQNVVVLKRQIRVLRQRFRGVMFHLVPRIYDSGVAIFKMDCQKCGYKLAVEMDAVGDTGVCPICNADIVMPDCLDNLARVLELPHDVPIVQVQLDDLLHVRDLLAMVLDTILYSLRHPEKAEDTSLPGDASAKVEKPATTTDDEPTVVAEEGPEPDMSAADRGSESGGESPSTEPPGDGEQDQKPARTESTIKGRSTASK